MIDYCPYHDIPFIFLSEFLSSMDSSAPQGIQGRMMMERKLRLYLWQKGKFSHSDRTALQKRISSVWHCFWPRLNLVQ